MLSCILYETICLVNSTLVMDSNACGIGLWGVEEEGGGLPYKDDSGGQMPT